MTRLWDQVSLEMVPVSDSGTDLQPAEFAIVFGAETPLEAG